MGLSSAAWAQTDVSSLISDPSTTTDMGTWTNGGVGTFHRNTWSSEGASDGSSMTTPFYEYWRNKTDGSLADATISSTLTDMVPGEYEFSALVRIYNEAAAFTISGATMYANDGTTDLAEALTTATSTGNGYYGTPSVKGAVGKDGTLSVGFKIAKASFNWIAFKSVKLVRNSVDQKVLKEIISEQLATADTYSDAVKIQSGLDKAITTANSASTDDELIAATAALKTALANAEVINGGDATSWIVNPSFDGNNNGWTINASSSSSVNKEILEGTAQEVWTSSPSSLSMDIYQDVAGLPAGVYRLTAEMKNHIAHNDEGNGYVNGAMGLYAQSGSNFSFAGVAAQSDSREAYSVLITVADGETLRLGVKNAYKVKAQWFNVDNFTLSYVGADYTSIADDEAAVTSLSAFTTVALNEKQNADLKDAATSAIKTFNSSKTMANYEAVQTALQAVYTSISNYYTSRTVLDQTASFLANSWNSNVYDQSVLDSYETEYTNGTLTDALTYTSGRPSTGVMEQVLVSGWSNVGTADNDLYINTWSKEGNSDGSEYYNPFYEVWGSDANTIAAKSFAKTITGLTANTTYSISAWVRVQLSTSAESGATPAGITMQAGEGEAVDVCAGANIAGTSRYMGIFSAVGTADENGHLALTFTVAEGNNVSWLAFKDVNCIAQASVTVTEKGKYADEEYYATYVTETVVDLDKCDFTAYAISVGNDVEYTPLTGVVPAGTPLVVMAKAAGIYAAAAGSGQGTSPTTSLQASDGTATSDGSTYYILANLTNGLGWYLLSENEIVPAGKCYLIYEGSNGVKFIGLDDATTAISTVKNAVKSGARYNVSGQRVDGSYKGIVIENGKKYLVK